MAENNPTPRAQEGETLEDRLKRLEDEKRNLEKEKRGIISDLQSEREKRHELETRMGQIEQNLASAGNNNGENPDEIIQRFAKNPDAYIDSRVEARIKESERKLFEMDHQTKINDAYAWLAEQVGTSTAKLRGSEQDEEIGKIVKEYGLSEIDPRIGIKSAYKIYLQEQKEKKEREEKRTEAVQGNSTESVRQVINSGSSKFTAEQIRAMSPREYEQNREKILEANAKGLITSQ